MMYTYMYVYMYMYMKMLDVYWKNLISVTFLRTAVTHPKYPETVTAPSIAFNIPHSVGLSKLSKDRFQTKPDFL